MLVNNVETAAMMRTPSPVATDLEAVLLVSPTEWWVAGDRGAIAHTEGVGAVPGSYVLGMPFMRRRKSAFLDGVGDDARELAGHLVAHLATTPV